MLSTNLSIVNSNQSYTVMETTLNQSCSCFLGSDLNRVTVSDLPSIHTDGQPFQSDKIPDDSEIIDLVLEAEQHVSSLYDVKTGHKPF